MTWKQRHLRRTYSYCEAYLRINAAPIIRWGWHDSRIENRTSTKCSLLGVMAKLQSAVQHSAFNHPRHVRVAAKRIPLSFLLVFKDMRW